MSDIWFYKRESRLIILVGTFSSILGVAERESTCPLLEDIQLERFDDEEPQADAALAIALVES